MNYHKSNIAASEQRIPVLSSATIGAWLWRRRAALALALIGGWYCLATLPYLGDYPLLEWAQMGIVAPAYKLATQAVYGNDLFAGFYHTETYNYEYMPLYPFLVALSLKLLGLGVWQARIVSVLCGLATVLLTFRVGRQLFGSALGLVAAALLCCMRLGLDSHTSGVPLLDFARVIRYDILVPVLVLASCSCFYSAWMRESHARYVIAGVLAGLATLSHVYGAFILLVFAIVLIWEEGWPILRRPPLLLIAAGWLLTLLPWALYVAQDFAAYRGQMLRHESRFDVFELHFYVTNLLREPGRYLAWIGPRYQEVVLWPRVGFWMLLLGVPTASVVLWLRLRHGPQASRMADRLLLVALPTLALLLALLIDLKRYTYTVLVLPFLALQIAFAIVWLWRWATDRLPAARVGLVVALAAGLWEGGAGIAQSLEVARATTPYLSVTQAIARTIPPGTRILVAQPFWLGLASYEMRSINLAFVLSDPHYQISEHLTMAQAIDRTGAQYIVVEDYFISPAYAADPEHKPYIIGQWRAFTAYTQQRCVAVDRIDGDDYGVVDVFRCTGQGNGI